MKKAVYRVLSLAVVLAMLLSAVQIGIVFSASAEASAETKIWKFESADDLKDFNAYYWQRGGNAVKLDSITDGFKFSDGRLERDNSKKPIAFQNEGKPDRILALTLNDPTVRNFDVTYKLKKDTDDSYGKWIHVGMREKNPGQITDGKEWNIGNQLDGTSVTTFTYATNANPGEGFSVYSKAGNKKCNSPYKAVQGNAHELRIRLVEDTLNVWVDNNIIAENYKVSGDSQCGYLSVYFANTKGYIDDISFTRLDENGREIAFVPEIKFAVSPIALPLGVPAADVVKSLPAQVSAVYQGFEVPVTISEWTSKDYDEAKQGTYTFTADVKNLASYYGALKASVSVMTTEDIVKNTLDSADKINAQFASHFAVNITQGALKEIALTDKWTVTADGIKRNAEENADVASPNEKVAILTYKEKKLDNFVLSVNYKSGTDSKDKAPMLGFGSQRIGGFATDADGGIAVFVDANGDLNLWSNKLSLNPYSKNKYPVANYNKDIQHNLKMIVVSRKAAFFVDNVLTASLDLRDYKDGYVYMAMNSNSGSFNNFEISPLIGLTDVDSIAKTFVDLGTSKEVAVAALPAAVECTVNDGSKKNIAIRSWECHSYKPDYAGRYKFTGMLDADSSVNPAGLKATAVIEVREKYDPDITERYYFDNVDDMKYFDAYDFPEANPDVKGYEKIKEDWRRHWNLKEGMLEHKFRNGRDDTKNVSVLALNTKKYKNFELTVDFKQGTNNYRWAMIGFGAKGKGDFVLTPNGGRTVYLQKEGYISGWSREFVTGWEYHNVYGEQLENYDANAIHRMKLTVLGENVSVQIDDYAPVYMDAPKNYEGGYIYFAVNNNSALFDNLSIIDYDIKSRKIKSVIPEEQIVFDHNDKFAEYTLPRVVNVICDDGRAYMMPVEWKCDNLRTNFPGVYNHVGRMTMPSDKFSNPDKLKGSVDLKVIVDYDINTSIKYYFDTEVELNDFFCHATDTTANDGLKPVPTDEQWEIKNGRVARINHGFEQKAWSEEFACTKISTLLWSKKQLENFELEFDYKQGNNTWLWAMAMFGVKDPTKWILEYTGTDSGKIQKEGGYAVYAQQEGTATIWGSISSNQGYRKSAMLPGVVNYNRNAVNHMKVRVLNGVVSIYINNATQPLVIETADHDTMGRIGFACGMNLAEYDNLMITALKSNGDKTNINVPGYDPSDVDNGSNGGNSSNGGGNSPLTGEILLNIIISLAVFMACGAIACVCYVKYRLRKTDK